MSTGEARARLRAILDGDECFNAATVFNPLSARVANDLGFETALLGGSIASFAVLAAPDVIVLTLTELAEQVRRICRVAALPLMVDGDHGYGNALNVMRMVQELESAGAAAVTIEDTMLPRPFGSNGAPAVIPLEEAVGKVKAAIEARSDPDFLILGRSTAAASLGAEEAINRAKAFEAAGADALFIPGAKSRVEIDALASSVDLPLVLGGASGDLCDPSYLRSRNVRIWTEGHHAFWVALKSFHDALGALREGTSASRLPNLPGKDFMDRMTKAAAYDAWTQEYLR